MNIDHITSAIITVDDKPQIRYTVTPEEGEPSTVSDDELKMALKSKREVLNHILAKEQSISDGPATIILPYCSISKASVLSALATSKDSEVADIAVMEEALGIGEAKLAVALGE